ncbi:hypothetical protein [Dyella ginsengisoli]|uniref:hypothetical protein n=1 Tax=Dyella ginsengisoli TaxID=363848 RepID=UPI00034971F7|nr:hypothetical protein [Dyella ginsengisoli]
MPDFLRLLTPRHHDALRPAAPLRRLATPSLIDADPDPLAPSGERPAASAAWRSEQHHRTPPTTAPVARAAHASEPMPAAAKRPITAAPDAPLSDRVVDSPAPTARESVVALQLDADVLPPLPLARPDARAAQAVGEVQSPLDPRQVSPPLPSTYTGHARQVPAGAPLSSATVALYAGADDQRSTAPVVHVSIDRIEVRAPHGPKPATTTRRRTPPAQSLGDYLHGRERDRP